MVLLEATHLRMQIQDRELFHIEHLTVQENDRIGLVGINGSGKTTLLHILAEKTTPKTGTVHVHTSCALLPQLKQADSYQSGGEITQQYIDHVLAKKPSLLLLDEPTTNLDTMHIESLEKQLSRFVGAFVIISHDRFFLDQLCTKIWELDDGKLTSYQGNYTQYREQKELELRQQETAFDTYVAKKKQLEEALILKEEKAKRATKKPKKISPSEARIKGAK